MRFLLHGDMKPEAMTALKAQGHAGHAMTELADAGDPPPESPEALLKMLMKKQWQLMTTDADLVHEIYERKLEFPAGLIVLLLDGSEQTSAVTRLFERYPRLTPRRLYTVTPSRVKIRQLPGLPG